MRILTSFQHELETALRKSVKLTINNNRSTMLSVKWDPKCIKVSLHRFFLDAPENVMNDLACYIKDEGSSIAPTVKSFMEHNMRRMDYSNAIPENQLVVEGKIYNLTEMLRSLNNQYFSSKLNLKITWFGKRHQYNRSQVTFGLYYEPMKLIKINRLLDNPKFPDYLVAYVIYHEMLHHVSPSYYDEEGKHRIHSKEFKKMEQNFVEYRQAQDWIKKNKDNLFI
jgi:hypothetical protein